jgi:hypothetical protein
MKIQFLFGALPLLCFMPLRAQGTLQFNRVFLADISTGSLTVPVNTVWKIEANALSGGVRYSNYTTTSTTWSSSNPNPCNGNTSGSSGTLQYYRKFRCPDANNLMVVNSVKTRPDPNKPLWLPAGTTLAISQNICTNSVTATNSNTPYYIEDNTTSPIAYYWECDGPVNPGVVPNSILVSVIEFNIIP